MSIRPCGMFVISLGREGKKRSREPVTLSTVLLTPLYCLLRRDTTPSECPEMNTERLAVQLPMLRLNYRYSDSKEAAEVLTDLLGEVHETLPEVKKY